MKELVVISGKGGTGKTSLVASFAALAENHVMVDCDVDAADLHLVLNPEIKESHDYYGGKEAIIDPDLCTKCGKCREVCRFNAVDENMLIRPLFCEGCGACVFICPEKAIKLVDSFSGEWYISDTKYAPMVHAKLGIAEDNSGLLVSKIRGVARDIAKEQGRDLLITDGSPGIGCPVIASITGADFILIVIEPTLSGIHDLERVADLTKYFKVPAAVTVNKYDLNEEITDQAEQYCKENGFQFLTKLPYDSTVVKAQIARKPAVLFEDSEVAKKLTTLYSEISSIMKK